MSEKRVPFLVKFFLFIVPPIIGGIITYALLNRYVLSPLDPENTSVIRVEIPQGASLSQIAADLQTRGVIYSPLGLKVLSRIRAKGATIKVGEYELSPAMTPLTVLKKLISGDVVRRRVLVKEGATIWEIAQIVDQAGIITKDEFTAAATDKTFLNKAGISALSFEGYLYPETYFFSKPITPRDVIWTMFEEAEKHWPAEYSDKADALGMSRHDILTLASIIEKESGNFDEMPLVSSVFHNRLKSGMKLQSDPTIIYGLKNFNGNITKEDIDNPHPYNTYAHFGLPPGPIANPSQRAIAAALNPTPTSYLYFVADGAGRHVFSATLAEHNNAVAMYQLSKKPQIDPAAQKAP